MIVNRCISLCTLVCGCISCISSCINVHLRISLYIFVYPDISHSYLLAYLRISLYILVFPCMWCRKRPLSRRSSRWSPLRGQLQQHISICKGLGGSFFCYDTLWVCISSYILVYTCISCSGCCKKHSSCEAATVATTAKNKHLQGFWGTCCFYNNFWVFYNTSSFLLQHLISVFTTHCVFCLQGLPHETPAWGLQAGLSPSWVDVVPFGQLWVYVGALDLLKFQGCICLMHSRLDHDKLNMDLFEPFGAHWTFLNSRHVCFWKRIRACGT